MSSVMVALPSSCSMMFVTFIVGAPQIQTIHKTPTQWRD